MANTVDSIGEQATLDGLINHTLTEFEDNRITNLKDEAFMQNDTIERIILPSLTEVGNNTFNGCTNLEYTDIGDTTEIGGSTFADCFKLKFLDTALITKLNAAPFSNCYSFNDIDFSNLTTTSSYALQNAYFGQFLAPKITNINSYLGSGNGRLSVVDLGSTYKQTINTNALKSNYSLCHLIIRSPSLVALNTTNSLDNTPIRNGIGWIYVPSDLVDTYKSAINWSTLSNQIVSINEYPKVLQNETITDSWSDIIAATENGTYSKYSLGDIKYCNIGGTDVPMQIVAFDSDTLSGGGNSHITFISLGAIGFVKMNPTNRALNGWRDCMLREILRESIYYQIEEVVRNAIKPVIKTYLYDNNTLSTTDTVWIPSVKEMYGGSDQYNESQGAMYSSFFSYCSKKQGMSSYSSTYWLRSSSSSYTFHSVNTSGIRQPASASETRGLVVGFCI